jgi:hypothetical protein
MGRDPGKIDWECCLLGKMSVEGAITNPTNLLDLAQQRAANAGPDGASKKKSPARKSMGILCGFGAYRVGAFLSRLRLHLQTERFLAVQRGDRIWDQGCLEGTLAIQEIVSGMTETEMNQRLPRWARFGRGTR